ncbi:MAG: hypothetical protein JNL73_01725 [Anaerolineales bacterium]|nr:hypothetical protein [Anaerolineales bacterium]
MPVRLEPDYVLLNVADGVVLDEAAPGLAVTAAPRRSARGREKDILFLCLTLRSRNPIADARYEPLLELAAATFFGQSGSVTAAARLAVMAVNKAVLDGNLREGTPLQGGITLGVLRGGDFYATLVGPGVVTVARGIGLQRFPAVVGRPLGVSDNCEVQYFHTAVEHGDYVALSPNAAWPEAALAGLGGLSTLQNVTERLKAAAGGDFAAIAMRLEAEGTGAVGVVTPTVTTAVARPPARPVAPEPVTPTAIDDEDLDDEEDDEDVVVARPLAVDTNAHAGPYDDEEDIDDDEDEDEPEAEAAPSGRNAARLRARLEPVKTGALFGLRSFGRATGVTLTEFFRGLNRLTARSLPEGMLQQDGMLAIPGAAMLIAAVAIPLIIVGLAALIYIQLGQQEQYTNAVQQAQLEISRATAETDPVVARPHWDAAVRFIDVAERMRPGQTEIAELRRQAEGQLDQIDQVQRLTFEPLLAGGTGGELSKVALLGNDVYALDARGNRLVRIAPTTAGGYVLDPTFKCSAGAIGSTEVGTLVDFFILAGPIDLAARPGEPAAPDAIIALDQTGTLLYCFPGREPIASPLATPDTGFGQAVAAELFGTRLYVLDTGRNQIWQYDSTGGAFPQRPVGYFSETIFDLKDVIHFTIANGDLLLLRADGRAMTCARALPTAPPSCINAAQYSDTRIGRTSGTRLADAVTPLRFVYDAPPEPSVLLVDSGSDAIFQLSLKLAVVSKYKPANTLAGPITSVIVGPAERLFVAAGDNVYRADRP